MRMGRHNQTAGTGTHQPRPAAVAPSDLPAWPAAQPAPAAHPRLPRILRCIEEELCDPALGTDALQRRFFVSRPTLYRMFRPLGGVARYIRERRLLLAYGRLRDDTDCTITFLLYDLGFESERQFQRAFQGRFGMSPTRWRQLCRSDAQAPVPRRCAGGGHGLAPATQACCG
jgi:AraC-like DNA-binding protein